MNNNVAEISSGYESTVEACFFDMKEKVSKLDQELIQIKGLWRSKMSPLSLENRVLISYADPQFQADFFDFSRIHYTNKWRLARESVCGRINFQPEREALCWVSLYYFLVSDWARKIMADGSVHLACALNSRGAYSLVYMRWGGQGFILRSYPPGNCRRLLTGPKYWLKIESEGDKNQPTRRGRSIYFSGI